MTPYADTGTARKKRRKRTALLGACAAAALLVLLCGLPLPAAVGTLKGMHRARVLRERVERLEREGAAPARLEAAVASLEARLLREAGEAFPRVDDLFTLRDLVLAMGRAAGVSSEEVLAAPPAAASRPLPGGKELVLRTQMELRGAGTLEEVVLLAGLLEAAGNAFSVKELELTPFSMDRPDRVEFRLDLEVLFRGPIGLEAAGGPEATAGTGHER